MLRINDVDLSKMTMSQINDIFSKAKGEKTFIDNIHDYD